MPKVGERYKNRCRDLILTLTRPIKTRKEFERAKGKKITTDFLLSQFYNYGNLNIGDRVKDNYGRAWTVSHIWDKEQAIGFSNIDIKEECRAFNEDNLTKIGKINYWLRRICMKVHIIALGE